MKRITSVPALLAGAASFIYVGIVFAAVPAGNLQDSMAVPSAATTVATAAADVGKPAAPKVIDLGSVKVQGERLNRSRATLNPETGTSSYHFDVQSIASLPQGYNAPLQDVLLQAPGVAQDSFGQLHVRGDHADIQYRINGVILPEAISGFGDTLGTRFISKVDFLTGALPAQYGYRTAGIVNITTSDGLDQNGGTVDLYGGSHGTFQPSFDYGGTEGKLDYYVTGSYLQSDLGIESPTADSPDHDHTKQNRLFGYGSYLLNSNLRLSVIAGHSLGNFEIPNNPDQSPAFQLQGVSSYPSSDIDETQRELNDYGIVSLQGIQGALNYQVSLFNRYSSVDYHPDPTGDLIYNGVAARVFRRNIATGIQEDTSYAIDPSHTLRWGLFADQERTSSDNTSSVFPADSDGNQTSHTPFDITDNSYKNGELYGAYAQDEWQMSKALTVNYGLRYDISNGYVHENQLSPRVNFVYKLTDATSLHGGFSRYFTPPELELIAPSDIALFQGTTNALPGNTNTDVRAERDSYYDLGLTHSFTPAFQVGLDGYYKDVKNLLDEGQFGQALVFSPFNYAHGRVWGLEFTSTYQYDDLSSYFNLSYGRALGNQVVSGQYNFDPDEL
ncbi:MAG: TonB-dependent receptor, partial [Gammaproteobacteria bacterium]